CPKSVTRVTCIDDSRRVVTHTSWRLGAGLPEKGSKREKKIVCLSNLKPIRGPCKRNGYRQVTFVSYRLRKCKACVRVQRKSNELCPTELRCESCAQQRSTVCILSSATMSMPECLAVEFETIFRPHCGRIRPPSSRDSLAEYDSIANSQYSNRFNRLSLIDRPEVRVRMIWARYGAHRLHLQLPSKLSKSHSESSCGREPPGDQADCYAAGHRQGKKGVARTDTCGTWSRSQPLPGGKREVSKVIQEGLMHSDNVIKVCCAVAPTLGCVAYSLPERRADRKATKVVCYEKEKPDRSPCGEDGYRQVKLVSYQAARLQVYPESRGAPENECKSISKKSKGACRSDGFQSVFYEHEKLVNCECQKQVQTRKIRCACPKTRVKRRCVDNKIVTTKTSFNSVETAAIGRGAIIAVESPAPAKKRVVKHKCVGNKRIYEYLEHPCRCDALGDPHFLMYDGVPLHFQGECKYTLTKLKTRRIRAPSTCRLMKRCPISLHWPGDFGCSTPAHYVPSSCHEVSACSAPFERPSNGYV
uniref:VWFD domain-containing protein n=1 Tax=Macrostomum lignano TaxID=282301 RepID=A0A1I8JP74_9PLAT